MTMTPPLHRRPIEDAPPDARGRGSAKPRQCPPLDLEHMLSLEEKRKTTRRGAFLTNADVPRRSIIEHNKIIDYLRSQGFTLGLARKLIQNSDEFPARIWLINNSESMNQPDGHLVVQSSEPPFRIQNVDCTRWEEVSSSVRWHADFSARMEAPMAIRLLNEPLAGPQQLGIAVGQNFTTGTPREEEIQRLREVLSNRPVGRGCLTTHLREVVNAVTSVPRFQLENRSIAIVFVTDSLPSSDDGQDGDRAAAEFLDILQRLEGLPVYVVIRLSTDDENVVSFYSDLDTTAATVEKSGDLHSGLHLDVLDDYVSEAEDIYKHNPWLNYGYPLHLCRESAVNFPVFDALNDRPLLHSELSSFISLVFDRQNPAFMEQPLPNPRTDYKAFREELQKLVQKNGALYNPVKKRIMPWIDMRAMDRIYGQGNGGAQAATSCACTLM